MKWLVSLGILLGSALLASAEEVQVASISSAERFRMMRQMESYPSGPQSLPPGYSPGQEQQMRPAAPLPAAPLSESEDEEILRRVIAMRNDVAGIRVEVRKLKDGYEEIILWQGDAIVQLRDVKVQLAKALEAQDLMKGMLQAGYQQLQELRGLQAQTQKEVQIARGQAAQAEWKAQSAQASADAAWAKLHAPGIWNLFGLLGP